MRGESFEHVERGSETRIKKRVLRNGHGNTDMKVKSDATTAVRVVHHERHTSRFHAENMA